MIDEYRTFQGDGRIDQHGVLGHRGERHSVKGGRQARKSGGFGQQDQAVGRQSCSNDEKYDSSQPPGSDEGTRKPEHACPYDRVAQIENAAGKGGRTSGFLRRR
eukprot:CAMPEP_0194276904 /NCGR_PEP_ID=MMETSP0169-20130528/9374_1 /TAXON_ID=218684 /ORGANISM="Corethron pennatum, Strain L29A3" /LENGTH=103 /DNA_ID=CAMNT_0039020733 /DNA_START=1202 /DNA_END=1513 /DNA_ORIENTATION=+